MQEKLNIILTENVTSFKMTLPFKVSLPYLFDHKTKHLVCNLTHQRFSNLFLSSQKQKTAKKFNNRYKSIFLSSDAIPTQDIKNIINDIERINLPQSSVVDLLINADVFDDFNKFNLISWVEMMNTLASDKQIFVNLFIFGEKVGQQLLSQALAESSQIKSLSIIKTLNSNSLRQEVIFVHSKTGVIVNQTQEHTLLHDDYQTNIIASKIQSKIERTLTTTPEQIHTTKDFFIDDEFAPVFFQVSERFDDLCAAIPTSIPSTVVLPCKKYADIQDLAHFAYRLRKDYHAESKLIIREMKPCIRYSDEQFLLHCGVNLIIPMKVPFYKVLGQISAIQNHLFNLQLPTSAKSLTNLRAQFDFQGYYQADQFKNLVLGSIAAQNTDGVEYALVRLDVITDMPIGECVKLCQIKRNGDIYTTFNYAIYIFFSGIRSNDIAAALHNVFGINVLEYFSRYEIFSSPALVHDELMLMKGKTEFLPADNTKQADSQLKLVQEKNEQFLFARKSNFTRSNKKG